MFNVVIHDVCMPIADSHVWYFDRGATKHITLHCDMFTSLESALIGNSITFANKAINHTGMCT